MLRLFRLLAPYVVWLYPIAVVVLLLYLRSWVVASRDLRASLFTLEREVASARMRKAASGAFGAFGALVLLFFLQFFVGRNVDLNTWIRPTPTPEFIPHSAYATLPAPNEDRTPAPLYTPTNRPTRRPTVPPTPTEPLPTPTPPEPTLVPPPCPNVNARIVQPGQGQVIRGTIDIRGSADIPGFQFYKVELGLGERPVRWTSISDVHRNAVSDGLLEVWDTSDLPAGSYSLRLVVVDASGNYPPPCEVVVTVTH
ncbi:MAG: hypothetical protein ACUVX9_12150 [Anaerolineae bacterium]